MVDTVFEKIYEDCAMSGYPDLGVCFKKILSPEAMTRDEQQWLSSNINPTSQVKYFGKRITPRLHSNIYDIQDKRKRSVINELIDVYNTGTCGDEEEIARFENAIHDAVEYMGFNPGMI